MYLDIILQQVHVADVQNKRMQERLMNDQLRMARMSRPSHSIRLARALGLMLISIGERLRNEPATVPGTSQGGAPTARTI